jgi:hypothetical protein
MAAIARTQMTRNGGSAVNAAAASGGGDTLDNKEGKSVLYVKNGSGGDITVTIAVQNASGSDPIRGPVTFQNLAITVVAGTEKLIGPIAPGAYNDGNGLLNITYSATATVTVQGFVLP